MTDPAPEVQSGESFENPYADSAELAQQIRAAALAKMRKSPKSRVIAPGRRCAMMVIDALMAKHTNIQKLADAFQERFDADPAEFYKTIVEPVLPKDVVQNDLGEGQAGSEQGSTVIVLPPNGREPVIVRPDGEDHA